ncbi:GL19384 [Drosophila persimilis]|uniref:Tumor suppressor candidate 3 n=2 Tax=pseudoobscura subgroup TaxID=32358 RepID=Q29MN1_DROPS|nr:tumor suppressor candidate 3 [Drosophila pseudoobscura]XP_002014837.1 tumor suppressor candidate 3 [Drosophila persimilis]XP_017151611.1 tumor suppressor candidate 3 [Drosophila miranda]EDW28833.1 GL19384 [Drosophila persimilis]
MRLVRNTLLGALVVLAVCLIYAAAQAKPKTGLSLSEKVQNLVEMNAKKPLLRFNGPKFREYVKNSPRNYSMIVMLTALAPSRQCQICRHAHDEFAIVANSYRFSSVYSNKLFFAMVDFDEGSEVFQLLRLNTAPVFMHFPAKGKPKGADTMDIHRVGFAADSIAKFVAERVDVTIRIFRPPNYSGTVAMITLVALVGSFLYIRRNNLEFLYNKNLWGAIAVFFCFAMISGQMWNHIRGPPLVHKSQNGGVAYIHGSSQGQLVVETYIVMFLNAMIVLGMILLIESGTSKGHNKNRIMAMVGLVLVTVFFSFLLSVFRSKAQGYPYSFLFK